MTTMFGEAGARSTGSGGGFLGSFIKTLAFVMLCGIVGPIFLVMYFVLDEPMTEWMLWSGLGITILNVIIAYFMARGASRSRIKMARMQQTGHMAIADITSLTQTSMQVNDQPVMKLGLRIHGEGVPTFDVEVRKVVPIVAQAMLHRRVLAVLVDPATKEFEIDWQATGMLAGSVPSQFTSSEDGRTYDLTGQPEPLIRILEVLRRNGVGNSGTIDLRSNPAARAEVMAIVRQYGAQAPTSPYGAAPSPGGRFGSAGAAYGGNANAGSAFGGSTFSGSAFSGASTSLSKPEPERSLTERLAELDALYAAGRINTDEYQKARARALGL